MDGFRNIEQKLEHFIRRYYLSALLKGLLLFFAIGLLFGMLVLSIEHFFWLNSFGRLLLFTGVIGFEVILFYGLIFVPLAKYFKIQKGINFETASKIVGEHFPEVKDKLLNVLQLKQQPEHTEFLLASIEQKSKNLSLVSFRNAVNFSENLKYLRYAAAPILIVLLCTVFGKQALFTDSLKRVVNYKIAYVPPAPFEFFIMNSNLEAIENRRAECGLSLSCEPYIGNSNRPDELGFVEDVCLSCEKYVSNIWMYKQETKAKFHLPSRTPTLTWKLCKFVFLLMQKFHPQVPAAGHRREPVRFFGGRSSICFTGWDSCIICWRR